MKVVSTERLPIKMWLDDLEEGALAQARNLANLPFAFRHVAVMPDGHQGYGMPIGGVLATRGVIVPNAVGVDIGCGVCAVRTSLEEVDAETLRAFVDRVRAFVPVGFSWHEESQEALVPAPPPPNRAPVVHRELEKAAYQIGTLGGGTTSSRCRGGPTGTSG